MDIQLRNICFIRHAKSSWDFPSLSDPERPLNHRGLRDAPFMAAKMRELGNIPDLLVSSPAVRARETAEYFRTQFEINEDKLLINNKLYGAGVEEIVNIVRECPDEFTSIFVFGHNPTMTLVANKFAGVIVDNVPTCGILQAKTMVTSWKQWSPDVSAFVGFYYPKQYQMA